MGFRLAALVSDYRAARCAAGLVYGPGVRLAQERRSGADQDAVMHSTVRQIYKSVELCRILSNGRKRERRGGVGDHVGVFCGLATKKVARSGRSCRATPTRFASVEKQFLLSKIVVRHEASLTPFEQIGRTGNGKRVRRLLETVEK